MTAKEALDLSQTAEAQKKRCLDEWHRVIRGAAERGERMAWEPITIRGYSDDVRQSAIWVLTDEGYKVEKKTIDDKYHKFEVSW